MLKQTILFLSTASLLGAAIGCSSSSNNPVSGGTDASTVTPEGDGSTTPVTTADGSTTGSDSSSPPQSDDAGPTCPAIVDPSTDIPTYAAAAATLGNCTSAQVTAFVAACYAQTATGKTCNAWFNDTTNTTCGNCVSPSDSNGNPITGGPQLVNPTSGDVLPNTPGCVALVDTTSGPTCAPLLANVVECQDVACGQCDQTAYAACLQTVSTSGGACVSYETAASSPCASDVLDGGVASQTGECQDPTFIFNLYCGGADGGTVAADAGADSGDGG